MPDTACERCSFAIPDAADKCPHCGQSCKYPPNVRAARRDEERDALDQHYRAAQARSEGRGCKPIVEAFEVAASRSHAVISRSLLEAERLATSDRELYATYYQQIEAEHRSPTADGWDSRRRIADAALFPGYERSIRFAALSLDREGVASYGGSDGLCFLTLRGDMIEDRASVFEDNSTIVLESHGYKPPAGARAPWENRAKLCVAKLADDLLPDSLPEGSSESCFGRPPSPRPSGSSKCTSLVQCLRARWSGS